MATRDSEGVSGKLTLSYDFYESASGHHETTRHIKLIPGCTNSVVLEDYHEETGIYRGMKNSRTIEKHEIDSDVLIQFIKTNGRRI